MPAHLLAQVQADHDDDIISFYDDYKPAARHASWPWVFDGGVQAMRAS